MNKKLVFITDEIDKSGVPVHLLHLINGLKFQFEITLIAPDGWLTNQLQITSDQLRASNEQFAVNVIKHKTGFSAILKTRSILKNFPAGSIIHFHGVSAGIWGRIAAYGLKLKLFYTEHNWTNDYALDQQWREKIQLFLLKFTSGFTTRIICVSAAVKKFYLDRNLANDDRLQLIYNGVEFTDFTKTNDGMLVLGTAGSLTKRKRHDLTITAVAELKKTYPQIKLIIAGDGPLKNELQNLAQKLGMSENVEWLGNVDLKEFWTKVDLYIQSSRDESFGMALAEAIGNGIPSVSSDVGAVSELMDTEYVFNKGDVKDLISKINKVFNNYDSIYTICQTQKSQFRARFSKERMLEEYSNLFQS